MTLQELIDEVYVLTSRPDLVAETKSAIKAATLKAHQSDFYSKDIYETGVEFAVPSCRQSLDYISLVSNFRALKYFRQVSDRYDDLGTTIEVITPDEIFTAYGVQRTNIAYVAGRVLEIRTATELSKALMGCYVLPNVTDRGYLSWVAEQYPYAIIYEAARVVFKAIGYDEQSNSFERLVAEQYRSLRAASLTDVGY